jgi:four helix bundle protein
MGVMGEQPGSGPGSGSFAGAGTGTGTKAGKGGEMATQTEPGSGKRADPPRFDHEKLEVYQVAREFLVLVTGLLTRKLPRDLRDQFDRATSSILFNIGEGAGKTARADKQRSYEIARGSTTEAATQLDLLNIRGFITDQQYQQARALLVRVAQMLARMCGQPRRT